MLNSPVAGAVFKVPGAIIGFRVPGFGGGFREGSMKQLLGFVKVPGTRIGSGVSDRV